MFRLSPEDNKNMLKFENKQVAKCFSNTSYAKKSDVDMDNVLMNLSLGC